eukprot:COSAG01_NODE_46_length_32080_cov_716.589319_26_plen_329_part_00
MNDPDAKLPFQYNPADLSKVLFPVEMRPVFVPMPENQQGELFQPTDLRHIKKYKAVVDVEREHVFSIVSDKYQLITNEKAVHLGATCFQTVFKLTDAKKMKLFNIIKPDTRSYCHIDFVHEEGKNEIFSDDSWTPFLRITNSYNRTYALNFDLGFCRGICNNGLIFGKNSIEFKFTHTRSAKNDPDAQFNLKSGEFVRLEQEFIESLRKLKRFHVPRKFMWPLLCKLFEMKIPTDDTAASQRASWQAAEEIVDSQMTHYFDQLGENGYAALNVLTDFATRPPKLGFGQARVNTMQTHCGNWTEEFSTEINSEDFSFEKYLGEYLTLAV